MKLTIKRYPDSDTTGLDKGALFTATAIASAIATFLLAFMAKLPFAQAPQHGTERLLRLHPLSGDGICLGILSYVLIKMMVGKFKDLNPTLYILSVFLLFNYAFG